MQNQEHCSSEREMQYLHPETVQSCSVKFLQAYLEVWTNRCLFRNTTEAPGDEHTQTQ